MTSDIRASFFHHNKTEFEAVLDSRPRSSDDVDWDGSAVSHDIPAVPALPDVTAHPAPSTSQIVRRDIDFDALHASMQRRVSMPDFSLDTSVGSGSFESDAQQRRLPDRSKRRSVMRPIKSILGFFRSVTR